MGLKRWAKFLVGVHARQKKSKSCKKYKVEKYSSELEMRAKGDYENVIPFPKNSEKEGKGGPGSGGSQQCKLY